jgi:hypothetical protein
MALKEVCGHMLQGLLERTELQGTIFHHEMRIKVSRCV